MKRGGRKLKARLKAYQARVSALSVSNFSSWASNRGLDDPLVVAAREAEIRALLEELNTRCGIVRRLISSTACNFHGYATGCCEGHCMELRLLLSWCDLLLAEKRRALEQLARLVGSRASEGGQ